MLPLSRHYDTLVAEDTTVWISSPTMEFTWMAVSNWE